MKDKFDFLMGDIQRHRRFLKKSYVVFWVAVFFSFFFGNVSSVSYLIIGGIGLFSTLNSGSKKNKKDDSFLLFHKDVFGVTCSVFFICFVIPFVTVKSNINFFNMIFSLCFICFYILHCLFVKLKSKR